MPQALPFRKSGIFAENDKKQQINITRGDIFEKAEIEPGVVPELCNVLEF